MKGMSAGAGTATSTGGWTVVVPVKGMAGAKSRLAAGVEEGHRRRLALAFALDTLETVLAARCVDRVVLVTSEPLVREPLAGRAGVEVVTDPGGGLGAAVQAGIAAAPPGRCAVLLADLPAVRPDELDWALTAAAAFPRAMVPDAEDTGTVLLTGLEPDLLVPRFGPGSCRAHQDAGHRPVEVPAGSGLRRDVDRPEDLAAVGRMGVGRHTRAVLAGSPDAAAAPGAAGALDDAGAPGAAGALDAAGALEVLPVAARPASSR